MPAPPHSPGPAGYPATAGEPALRTACAGWMQRRYGVTVNAATQVLPVNGSREALFAFAQTVIDPTRPGVQGGTGPIVVSPNPFYQIYEGAALLAGRHALLCPQRPRTQLCRGLGQRARQRVGQHPVAVCVLARQPHRRGDAAGRMGKAVRLSDRTAL
jgi:histidinol-phosphate/aromatic aminotransferase/cobyric acid decarboxylase-like protein